MADSNPSPEVLENLELLLDWEILRREKDWKMLRDLEQIPSTGTLTGADTPDEKDGSNGH